MKHGEEDTLKDIGVKELREVRLGEPDFFIKFLIERSSQQNPKLTPD